MPSADQRLGVEQALHRVVAHAVGRMPVLQHLAGDQAKAPALRFLHQRVHRRHVRGGEGERRGHAVARQLVQEKACHLGGMLRFMEARLVREGVVLQPGQQPVGGRADHVGLRVVDVQIDEARRDDAAGPVGDGLVGVGVPQRRPGAGGDHALHALRVGGGGQQTIFFIQGRAIVGKTQKRAAVQVLHGTTVRLRAAGFMRPWRWALYAQGIKA